LNYAPVHKKEAEKPEKDKKDVNRLKERRRERSRSPVKKSGYLGQNYDWKKDPKNREYDFGSRNNNYNSRNSRYDQRHELERNREQPRDNGRGRELEQWNLSRQLCGQTVYKNDEPDRNEKWLGSMGQTANQIFLENGDFKSCTRKIENQQEATNQKTMVQAHNTSQNTISQENIYSKCLIYCETNAELREQGIRDATKMVELEGQLNKKAEKHKNLELTINKLKNKIQTIQETNDQRQEPSNAEVQQLKKEETNLRMQIKKRDLKLENAAERYNIIEAQLSTEKEIRRKAEEKVNSFIDSCTCNGYLFN